MELSLEICNIWISRSFTCDRCRHSWGAMTLVKYQSDRTDLRSMIARSNVSFKEKIMGEAVLTHPTPAVSILGWVVTPIAMDRYHCPASRTTLVATRFRVAVICPIIQVPHCIRVFFYFVWFVFINHIFQFYYELCTYCNILDIYLS